MLQQNTVTRTWNKEVGRREARSLREMVLLRDLCQMKLDQLKIGMHTVIGMQSFAEKQNEAMAPHY
jgi:hypothetical protein